MAWTPRRQTTTKSSHPVIFVFRSGKKPDLNAFSLVDQASSLPASYGPWISTGNVPPNRSLPHGLSRDAAEKALAANGFVLWRMKPDPDSLPAKTSPKAS